MTNIVKLRKRRHEITVPDIVRAVGLLLTLEPRPKEIITHDQLAMLIADWKDKERKIQLRA